MMMMMMAHSPVIKPREHLHMLAMLTAVPCSPLVPASPSPLYKADHTQPVFLLLTKTSTKISFQ